MLNIEKHNNFRRIFCPTESEIKQDAEQLKKLRRKLLDDRDKNITLIKNESNLFCTDPFGSFIGDCECCSHYNDMDRGFITGGYCILHNMSCGYGFICKDNDSKDNIGWGEFEKIQRKVM